MTKQRDLTFNEVCQELGKSKRTISRYISKGILTPDKIKTDKGILEYRFNRTEVEGIKNQDSTGQESRQNQKVDQKNEDILSLVKVLEKQLKEKDRQIKQMLERQRETNILMGQLQNKVLLLEDKSKDRKHRTEDKTSDTTGDTKGGKLLQFINRIFQR
jgi:transcriptional regulator with XRE-family HTH domain